MLRVLLVVLFLFPSAVHAADGLVIDLASDQVGITSGFSGADVVVFGSSSYPGGDVALVIRGPVNRVAVRRKSEIAGMWINRDTVQFRNVPRFYDYAVSGINGDGSTLAALKENGIGLNALVFEVSDPDDAAEAPEFHEALIRTRQRSGVFPLEARPVTMLGQGLFRTTFHLPANIPTGQYSVEAYVFESGRLVARQLRSLQVEQAGLPARIRYFAMEYSLAYAFICLLFALSAGLGSAYLSRHQR